MLNWHTNKFSINKKIKWLTLPIRIPGQNHLSNLTPTQRKVKNILKLKRKTKTQLKAKKWHKIKGNPKWFFFLKTKEILFFPQSFLLLKILSCSTCFEETINNGGEAEIVMAVAGALNGGFSFATRAWISSPSIFYDYKFTTKWHEQKQKKRSRESMLGFSEYRRQRKAESSRVLRKCL